MGGVVPGSSPYERELKGILSGDRKVLDKAVANLPPDERANYLKTVSAPFLVLRAGGSLGIDLVAVRGEFSFPIEVKAYAEDVIHFSDSPRLSEQAQALADCGARCSLLPVYAYKQKNIHKRDPWRLFTLSLSGKGPDGIAGFFYRELPRVGTTASGHLIMEWEKGLPLNRFLADFSRRVEMYRAI